MSSDFAFTLEASESYYAKASITTGVYAADPKPERVPAETGRKIVSGLALRR